jgi:arsenite-transporting ATPase
MAAWTDGLIRHRERSDEMANVIGRLAKPRPKGDDLSHFDQHAPEGGGDDRFAPVRASLMKRRQLFHRARHLLLDEKVTSFVLVLIPERLPVLETERAVEALKRFHVPVSGLVVNRILPQGSLGPFLEERRAQESEYLAQIASRFSSLAQVRVPMFAKDVGGLDALREVARHLFPTRA